MQTLKSRPMQMGFLCMHAKRVGVVFMRTNGRERRERGLANHSSFHQAKLFTRQVAENEQARLHVRDGGRGPGAVAVPRHRSRHSRGALRKRVLLRLLGNSLSSLFSLGVKQAKQ